MSEESSELVENRQSKVVALYTKGFTQEEIAKELSLSQPTVSRDLGEVRKQSRKAVEQQVTEEALFEFSRWTVGLDQMVRSAWSMAEDLRQCKGHAPGLYKASRHIKKSLVLSL